MENSEFAEPWANRTLYMCGSFDAIIDVADLLVKVLLIL